MLDKDKLENAEGDGQSTRNFEPVNNPQPESGSTKTFDTVDGKDKGDAPEAQKSEEKQGNELTARAAKATVSTVLFALRKVSTYLLNFLLTVLLVGIITGAVVAVCFVFYIKDYVDPNFTGLDNLKFDSALSTTMYYVDENGRILGKHKGQWCYTIGQRKGLGI